jgi:hypothetical protein
VKVRTEGEDWCYGDSDSACVSPVWLDDAGGAEEWRRWFIAQTNSPALDYWLAGWRREFREELTRVVHDRGREPFQSLKPAKVLLPPQTPRLGWVCFPNTGIHVCRTGAWTLRWDLSPLGYLNTAAHGHLDALHLSIWLRDVAMVIDPGTGCYYADLRLRAWLASRAAHNGPHSPPHNWPARLGPFLWKSHHPVPRLEPVQGGALRGRYCTDWGDYVRTVRVSEDDATVIAEDSQEVNTTDQRPADWIVRWQFAPGATLESLGERHFRVRREAAAVEVEVSPDWAEVLPVTDKTQVAEADAEHPLAGTVSPAFRRTLWAPYLKLVARPSDRPGICRTTFLASSTP